MTPTWFIAHSCLVRQLIQVVKTDVVFMIKQILQFCFYDSERNMCRYHQNNFYYPPLLPTHPCPGSSVITSTVMKWHPRFVISIGACPRMSWWLSQCQAPTLVRSFTTYVTFQVKSMLLLVWSFSMDGIHINCFYSSHLGFPKEFY